MGRPGARTHPRSAACHSASFCSKLRPAWAGLLDGSTAVAKPAAANPGAKIIDPHFDRRYSQFCYQLQYLPGKTTYLDTPVLPIAAFAGTREASHE